MKIVDLNKRVDAFSEPQPELPTINVSNVQITNSALVGEIWWVQKGAEITITMDAALPDGQLMTMLERVVDATTVVDDLRTIITVTNGVATMTFTFEQSGNYVIREERVNRGLERIGAPFRIALEGGVIEFDVYV